MWPSIKDNIGDEKKPPANFDLVWEDTILSAKLAFDNFDTGSRPLLPLKPHCTLRKVAQSKPEMPAARYGGGVTVCVWAEDIGLIPPEAMLEVAQAVWKSKPSGEAISFIEQVKLSEELLNYRQRANNGLMSFQDFTAWHSRISQVPN